MAVLGIKVLGVEGWGVGNERRAGSEEGSGLLVVIWPGSRLLGPNGARGFGFDFWVTGWGKSFMPCLLGTGEVKDQKHLGLENGC